MNVCCVAYNGLEVLQIDSEVGRRKTGSSEDILKLENRKGVVEE